MAPEAKILTSGGEADRCGAPQNALKRALLTF